jgi:Ca2+-binding RTX toxin-like protein
MAGTNAVVLSANGTVADTAFNGSANIQTFTAANGGPNSVELAANASAAGVVDVFGGDGNDSFNASAYIVAVNLYGGNGDNQSGADTLIGGGGADWLQGWTNTTASSNNSNDTLTGGAGVDTFVLGNAVSNAYGQFNAVNPFNKYAQITDYDVAAGDLLRVWSNDFDAATFVNNGTDTITLTKTAGAGAGNAYTLQYSQGAGSGTADLYMNGTSRLVASMSYTGDMTTATIGIFDLA